MAAPSSSAGGLQASKCMNEVGSSMAVLMDIDVRNMNVFEAGQLEALQAPVITKQTQLFAKRQTQQLMIMHDALGKTDDASLLASIKSVHGERALNLKVLLQQAENRLKLLQALHTAINRFKPTRGKAQTPADVSGPIAMDLILQMKESCGMCIHQHAYTKAVEIVAGSHFAALRQGAHATAHQHDVDSMQKFCGAVSVHDQVPAWAGSP